MVSALAQNASSRAVEMPPIASSGTDPRPGLAPLLKPSPVATPIRVSVEVEKSCGVSTEKSVPPFVTQPSEAVAVRSAWYQPGVLIESGSWPLSEAAEAEPLATSVPAESRTVQPMVAALVVKPSLTCWPTVNALPTVLGTMVSVGAAAAAGRAVGICSTAASNRPAVRRLIAPERRRVMEFSSQAVRIKNCESGFAHHTLAFGEPAVNGSSLTTMRRWPTS